MKNTTFNDLTSVLSDALTPTRNTIIKFNGCHENLPALLEKRAQVISLPYNDEEILEKTFADRGAKIAAVIMEPALTGKGLVLPQYGFLDAVRDLTQAYGASLIFDECVTSVHTDGGCQNIFEVEPDFTIANNDAEKNAQAHYNLESLTAILTGALERAAKAAGVAVQIPRLGSMYSIYFSSTPLPNYDNLTCCDEKAYAIFKNVLTEHGISLPASQFATNFITSEHTPEIIQKIIEAAAEAFAKISQTKI